MNSEVTSIPVITCVTSVVLLVSLWIVMSFCKMYSKQRVVFSNSNDIVIDSTASSCSSFESIVEEIYDAAKKSNCQDHSEKCINLLRLYPGYVNTPVSTKNFTPFLRACWTGSTPLVKYMLENGADVSLRSSVGDSAFYLAVHKIVKDKTRWDPSLLKLLYKSGCCVNARRLHGYTPLHLAADYGHAPLVGWLLSHGADPSATAVCGAKPVDLALLKGHAAVVDMLTIRIHDVPCSPVLPVCLRPRGDGKMMV
ncbi:hypothetical protein R5R35_008014 [Gryllus longicercus]|uniref:Uncharacterized protein n=1 Tax=Gryllus longicercus TaxID=2509291 RepID=A0AAN9Z1M1_9ORTH